MKDQFDPVKDNDACERVIRGTCQGDDYQRGDDLLGRTGMIIVDVGHMTAGREYEEHKTDYWYWEPVSAS